MLGRSKAGDMPGGKLNTIIGAGTVLEGTLIACDVTRVDGMVKGEVKSEGTIIVGTDGKVNGNICTKDIMVAGTVEGDIRSEGKVEVASTGRVYGDIHTKSIIIDEHAVFQGTCIMDEQREQNVKWEEPAAVAVEASAKEA